VKPLPLSFVESPDRKCTIYIFECGPFIKVGLTHDVLRRSKELLRLNPFDVRLAYYRTVHTSLAKKTEAAVHSALSQFKHRGEWFEIAAKDALPHLSEAWKTAKKAEGRMRSIRLKGGGQPGTVEAGNSVPLQKQGESA
jgi:hypothetical protein